MNLAYNDAQQELAATVRALLADKASSAQLRDAIDRGFDRALWAQMATQLGLHGLAIPTELGGSGFSFVESSIVFEETGRVLLASPFFSTIGLAANVFLCSDDDSAKHDLLPGLANGSTIATVAFSGLGGSVDLTDVVTAAVQQGGRWLVTGQTAFVVDGILADLLLVAARTNAGLSLFAVESGADGLSRTPMSPLDITRPLAKIDFVSTPARLVGIDGMAEAGLRAGLERAVACLAAEQVGAAQRCLDMAVEYSKTRVQFGRPIGSFQAIKHRAADMLVKVESARSASMYAAATIAGELTDEVPIAVAIAGAHCPEVLFFVAAENIQIHGGLGYTWEHDAHLYFRRAESAKLLFGRSNFHRDRLAGLVGL